MAAKGEGDGCIDACDMNDGGERLPSVHPQKKNTQGEIAEVECEERKGGRRIPKCRGLETEKKPCPFNCGINAV